MFRTSKKSSELVAELPAMPETWPKPEVSVYGERSAEITTSAQNTLKVLRGLSLAALVLGLPLVVQNANELESLSKHGQQIQGRVDNLRISRGKSTSYVVYYSYRQGTERIDDKETIGSDRYYQLGLGDPITVTILPSSPKVHRLGVVDEAWVRKAQGSGSALVFLISGIFGLCAWSVANSARKDRNVLANWTAATAQLIVAKSQSGGKGTTSHKLSYRVRLPDGKVRDDNYTMTTSTGLPVKTGEFFTVFLNPDEPASRPIFSVIYAERPKF